MKLYLLRTAWLAAYIGLGTLTTLGHIWAERLFVFTSWIFLALFGMGAIAISQNPDKMLGEAKPGVWEVARYNVVIHLALAAFFASIGRFLTALAWLGILICRVHCAEEHKKYAAQHGQPTGSDAIEAEVVE